MRLDQKLAYTYVKLIKNFRLLLISCLTGLLFKQKKEYKKILINRDGAFGDAIVSLPAINLIRKKYPSAQIDLLSINNGGISFNDIGLKEKLINNIYVVNKKERLGFIKKLKRENYDLFIQLPQNIGAYKSVRNIFLVRFYLKIKSAFGWDHGRIKSFLRTQKQFDTIPTETIRFINMLEKNNIAGDIQYPLNNKKPDNEKIENIISKNNLVAFLIGGKLQTKKWPIDHWVTLAKLIGDENKIIIIGGDNEKQDGHYIESKTPNTYNLCGELSIPELHYVFKHIESAISLDTGAMHLCDATNIKLVVLFSTRDLSNKWFPNNKNALVIEKVLPCSFCFKSHCNNHLCMEEISPEEVYSKLNRLMLDKPGPVN